MFPVIPGIGGGVGVVLAWLIRQMTGKPKVQAKSYSVTADYSPHLSENEIRPVTARPRFPRFVPSDLPDYLAANVQHHKLIDIRLKNENPEVAAIVVEPWGAADHFPFGANYHIVILLIEERLPEEGITFPEQMVCTSDWTEKETVIGDFELRDGALVLFAASFVGNIHVFEEDGTSTVAFG